ncbi:MAG: DNRLRE domain-containing protein [Deltaproteobacteria bacterium]|nr:DNRLRE domain-containing protein [Deltaproteobacteria bacterium]
MGVFQRSEKGITSCSVSRPGPGLQLPFFLVVLAFFAVFATVTVSPMTAQPGGSSQETLAVETLVQSCSSDADCDDSLSSTNDRCLVGGICGAEPISDEFALQEANILSGRADLLWDLWNVEVPETSAFLAFKLEPMSGPSMEVGLLSAEANLPGVGVVEGTFRETDPITENPTTPSIDAAALVPEGLLGEDFPEMQVVPIWGTLNGDQGSMFTGGLKVTGTTPGAASYFVPIETFPTEGKAAEWAAEMRKAMPIVEHLAAYESSSQELFDWAPEDLFCDRNFPNQTCNLVYQDCCVPQAQRYLPSTLCISAGTAAGAACAAASGGTLTPLCIAAGVAAFVACEGIKGSRFKDSLDSQCGTPASDCQCNASGLSFFCGDRAGTIDVSLYKDLSVTHSQYLVRTMCDGFEGTVALHAGNGPGGSDSQSRSCILGVPWSATFAGNWIGTPITGVACAPGFVSGARLASSQPYDIRCIAEDDDEPTGPPPTEPPPEDPPPPPPPVPPGGLDFSDLDSLLNSLCPDNPVCDAWDRNGFLCGRWTCPDPESQLGYTLTTCGDSLAFGHQGCEGREPDYPVSVYGEITNVVCIWDDCESSAQGAPQVTGSETESADDPHGPLELPGPAQKLEIWLTGTEAISGDGWPIADESLDIRFEVSNLGGVRGFHVWVDDDLEESVRFPNHTIQRATRYTIDTSRLSEGLHSVTVAGIESSGDLVPSASRLEFLVEHADVLPPPTRRVITRGAVEDSWVYHRTPFQISNFGDRGYLRVRGGGPQGTDHARVYLKFSVAGVSGSVLDATLRVKTKDQPIANATVWLVPNGAWNESTISWSNHPVAGAVQGPTIYNLAPNSWIEFDVSQLVSGNGQYTLVLATSDPRDYRQFWSREASPDNPKLTIGFQ